MPGSAGTVVAPLDGGPPAYRPHGRVRMGRLWIDALTFSDALETIAALVRSRRGGAVFTPNVDHVVLAERRADVRAAYRVASLVLVDGTPLLWAARLCRTPLPEKVSGSDLLIPLAQLAATQGWRVYVLGGGAGVAQAAAALLEDRYGVRIVGCDTPAISVDGGEAEDRPVVQRILLARPDLLLVALGSPKQELWITRVLPTIQPAVAVGIGAALDFVTGRVRRAPPWISSAGLEWLYRLGREPRRLWRRYLLRDPAFLLIVFRMLWHSHGAPVCGDELHAPR
jgi:N-acetylglucosaminyldiphosphoundecaprenol N-acetyl-beta-D-mannosaminyltransferase